MSNAYRDDCEAALQQVESLRRENDALRERIEQLEAGDAPPSLGHRSAMAGPFLAMLLSGLFFLVAAAVHAGFMYRMSAGGWLHRGPHCHGQALASGAMVEPASLRVVVSPLAARVDVDGLEATTLCPQRAWTAHLLDASHTHHVHVEPLEPGYVASDVDVDLAPGEYRRIEVELQHASGAARQP